MAACSAKFILPEYTSILDPAVVSTELSGSDTGFWLMTKGPKHKSEEELSRQTAPGRVPAAISGSCVYGFVRPTFAAKDKPVLSLRPLVT